jgi:hypothetical protein
MLDRSVVPSSWADTLVTLVLKKGDPTVWKNYRPIAVVQTFGKLFATILQQRLSDWMEANGFRAPAQTGFRPGHGTSHHAFVLQHLIAQQRTRAAGQKRLYVCFVDLEQAYDSVPRDRLWKRLYDLGVQGKLLFAIKALYDVGVNMWIRSGSGLLDPISATVGVKQGCPLSPLLFGIFIEGLEDHIRTHCPQAGPRMNAYVASQRIPLLMYADDAALVATNPTDLQTLLDATVGWCTDNSMRISTSKTKIVVFNSQSQPDIGSWYLYGHTISVEKCFKYLGVTFHSNDVTLSHMLTTATHRGWAALAGLKRRLAELHFGGNIRLSLYLYRAMVYPAALYGAEVWGHTCLGHVDPVARCNAMERFQRVFVRSALHLRPGTSVWVMYREAGLYPIQYACLKAMLRFIQRVLLLPEREYVAQALRASHLTHCMRPDERCTWFGRLFQIVRHILPADLSVSDVLDIAAAKIEVDTILQCWRRYHYAAVWDALGTDPCTATQLVTLCTYHRWFASPLPDGDAEWTHAPCIDCTLTPHKHMTSLVRFRTGNHDLLVDKLRRGSAAVPRHMRLCTLCASGEVQDAAHIVLRCPALQVARRQFTTVFVSGSHMPTLFTSRRNVAALAAFVYTHVRTINAEEEQLDTFSDRGCSASP